MSEYMTIAQAFNDQSEWFVDFLKSAKPVVVTPEEDRANLKETVRELQEAILMGFLFGSNSETDAEILRCKHNLAVRLHYKPEFHDLALIRRVSKDQSTERSG